MKKICLLLLVTTLLVACGAQQTKELVAPAINITVAEPDRIRFSGKGAGAGMMLMSSMGPMGIAIGVAIDEGIGKEIDENVRAENVDIRDIFRTAFIETWSQSQNTTSAEVVDIIIDRYGFIVQSGEGDPVAAQLHVTMGEKTLKFPEEFSGQEIPVGQLDNVKTDARLVEDLFRSSAAIVSREMLFGPAQ